MHVKHKEVDFVEAQEVEWVQWIMRSLLELVFARGSQGGKRDPFLRVWFPVNQPSCIVYMHKLATFGGLKQRLGRLGLLPVSLRSGDTNIDGPLNATTGLTKGHHTVEGEEICIRDDELQPVLCRRYKYGAGVYWECGHPCVQGRLGSSGQIPSRDQADSEALNDGIGAISDDCHPETLQCAAPESDRHAPAPSEAPDRRDVLAGEEASSSRYKSDKVECRRGGALSSSVYARKDLIVKCRGT